MKTLLLFIHLLNAPSNKFFEEGYKFLKEGNFKEALTSLNKAATETPNEHYVYYMRGVSQMRNNNVNAAIKDFDKSISLRSTAEAYLQKGIAYHDLGNEDAAYQNILTAREMNPELSACDLYLGIILTKKNAYDEALQYLSNYISKGHYNAAAHFNRAEVYKKLKKYDEAIPDYTMCLYNDKQNWKAYEEMGKIEEERNNLYEALKHFSMCAEIDGKNPDHLVDRGRLYFKLGLKENACIDINLALKNGSTRAKEIGSSHCN